MRLRSIYTPMVLKPLPASGGFTRRFSGWLVRLRRIEWMSTLNLWPRPYSGNRLKSVVPLDSFLVSVKQVMALIVNPSTP